MRAWAKVLLVCGACGVASLPAAATEPGMFLCPSPVIANDFWNEVLLIAKSGAVQMTREIGARIAVKHGCTFVAGERLKPVDFVAGQLAIAYGGGEKGWASPFVYIDYVNRPGAD